MAAVFVVAQGASTSNAWLTYLLFIVAGLLVGGAYSAHQAGNRALTIVAGALALVALVGAVLWLIGGMT